MRANRTRPSRWVGGALALAIVAAGTVPTTPAVAAVPPYQDPTQAERNAVTGADLVTYRLGSLLSGGGSAPSPNTATAWADMYDAFQRSALSTPLAIPLIYGVDAVHGHNNVHGATIFPHNIGLGATRDPALVQSIAGPRPRRSPAPESTGTSPRACA